MRAVLKGLLRDVFGKPLNIWSLIRPQLNMNEMVFNVFVTCKCKYTCALIKKNIFILESIFIRSRCHSKTLLVKTDIFLSQNETVSYTSFSSMI